jgi:hypothetical protein
MGPRKAHDLKRTENSNRAVWRFKRYMKKTNWSESGSCQQHLTLWKLVVGIYSSDGIHSTEDIN